ncbi:unnamed protein product, partial [Polarella glacialis]
SYFLKSQSLPDLMRHYQTHRGFHHQLEALKQPPVKRKIPVLSTESANALCLPRSVPGSRHGSNRNTKTGKRETWEEFWQDPKCVRDMFQPGTLALRCPGPPPKWMLTT